MKQSLFQKWSNSGLKMAEIHFSDSVRQLLWVAGKTPWFQGVNRVRWPKYSKFVHNLPKSSNTSSMKKIYFLKCPDYFDSLTKLLLKERSDFRK